MISARAALERAVKSRKPIKDIDARGVDLSDAKLRKLSVTFGRFEGANLQRAEISYGLVSDCTLSGGDLRDSHWVGTSFWQTWFDDCDARGANLASVRTTFCAWKRADLSGASFRFATFDGGSFDRATLAGAHLDDIRGKEISFARAQARDASFENASIESCSFKGADLRGAIFAGASLRDCDFRGSKLDGADFEKALLEGARFDGTPPDPTIRVRPQPPEAQLAEHLAKGRAAAAVALFDAWPSPEYRDNALFELRHKATRARAGTALLERALVVPEPRVQSHAAGEVFQACAREWDLSSLVEPLVALLDARPAVWVPRHPGEARSTMDIGFFAAAALGRMTLVKSTAARTRAALDQGMSGAATSRERCAGGLCVAAAYRNEPAGIEKLFASRDARVRTGVLRGLELALRYLQWEDTTPIHQGVRDRRWLIKLAAKAAKSPDRVLATMGRRLLRP